MRSYLGRSLGFSNLWQASPFCVCSCRIIEMEHSTSNETALLPIIGSTSWGDRSLAVIDMAACAYDIAMSSDVPTVHGRVWHGQ